MSHESPPFPQWFPATHWSLVRRAGSAGDESQALDELLRIYLPALKAHLVGRKRIAPDRAEDLLQGFILSKVLPEAQAVVDRAERFALSERDSLRVLDLLENPPAPNARLISSAKAGRTLA